MTISPAEAVHRDSASHLKVCWHNATAQQTAARTGMPRSLRAGWWALSNTGSPGHAASRFLARALKACTGLQDKSAHTTAAAGFGPLARPQNRCAAALLAGLVLMGLGPATGRAESNAIGRDPVLVLHSYGPDFPRTRSQQQGIEAVFDPLAYEYDLRIEYLDAIHNPDLLKGPLLRDLLQTKLAKQPFQVVLTTGNDAFEFARTHRAELFPDAPIVFMGLNGFDETVLQGERNITGVAEDGDVLDTLQLVQQLTPQVRRVIFHGMADDPIYQGIRATVDRDLAARPMPVETEFRAFPHVEALLADIGALPSDAAIFIIGSLRTREGARIGSQYAAQLVSSAAAVPLFTSRDYLVGHGALGGSVISGLQQGRLGAEMALQVLGGVRPAAIPVRRKVAKTLMFDHRQLVRFDIPASRLPPGAVVRFLPLSTLSISQATAWIAGVSILLLLVVSASLIIAVMQRRRSEAQVRALNQALEHRVAERTWALEQANRELESFAYSVSHDLRAPLRHIDGFLALLRERLASALDSQSAHYMSTIASAARRMSTLIDDLLAFSRMGRQEMSQEAVDLNGLVADVVHELAPEAEGRAIDWHIADLPVVAGDHAMLRVVLFNLISNALKYTSKREQARIEIGTQPGQAGEVVVFVRDNGAGFDMRFEHKLFGVFQRLHRVDEFEGTGIGLANVARIIARHRGRVWARGELDKGATFHFSLPASPGPAR